ncbi:acetyl esterase/lipase [Streptomyces africanus]|uniref:Acetyl esterase/lipase n=1 Tax=Streptomyces africanus TaxID=231024 RepID=A0ABU0QES2_9ACTN|nr:acetyl esterase/lipase [Streptomyces africanus]
MPVQRRHVPARLRQHFPRLVGHLQPGPRPRFHAALRARRIRADDDIVGVDHALSLTQRLASMEIPVELHVFPTGGHGAGLAEGMTPVGAWTSLCAEWLRRTV